MRTAVLNSVVSESGMVVNVTSAQGEYDLAAT
jgi:hypothetical protein